MSFFILLPRRIRIGCGFGGGITLSSSSSSSNISGAAAAALLLKRRIHLGRVASTSSFSLPSICNNNPTETTTLLRHHHHQRHPYHQHQTRRTFFFVEKPNHRIRDIIVNPDSIASKIKPGNLVDKEYKKTGNIRQVPVELAHGYFWMVGDLTNTKGKPLISNPQLIPAAKAQYFPTLLNCQTLTGNDDDVVELPGYCIRKNRSQDESAQSTLVAISCRDHGYTATRSWTTPFRGAFQNEPRVEIIQLHLIEGWFATTFLQSIIKATIKRNTPTVEQQKQQQHNNDTTTTTTTTLLCFHKDLEEFRDILRIHNVMAGYVFLLDGLGRVRFAGSGEASEEEIQRLIQFANQLTPLMNKSNNNNSNKNNKTSKGSGSSNNGGGSSSSRRKIRSRN